MHFKRCGFLPFLTAGLVIVVLMGCQSAPAQPTLMATVSLPEPGAVPQGTQAVPGGYPVEAPATQTPAGYPAGGSPASAPVQETANYPAPGGETGPASGVPAVDNRALVTATLIEQAPDTDNGSNTRLRVRVLAVQDVNGMPNLVRDLVNTETDLFIETGKLPELNPNDRFEALVSYTGDEQGGKFHVLEIKKLE